MFPMFAVTMGLSTMVAQIAITPAATAPAL
jgi:hypothetical protein